MKLSISRGKYNIPGVHYIDGAFNFCFEVSNGNADKKCEILLILIKNHKIEKRIAIDDEFFIGNLCCVSIGGIDVNKYGYLFCVDGKNFMDPSARKVYGREKWADEKRLEDFGKQGKDSVSLFAGFHKNNPADTENLYLKKEDIVMYHLNVRSFTADEKNGNRGTFAALIKKLPYLKKLGITALSLMPIYEFEEWIVPKTNIKDSINWSVRENDIIMPKQTDSDYAKVNVWGYSEGYYFAPKASFAKSFDAEGEVKELVKKCHDLGIMVIMDIFAGAGTSAVQVVDAMRYWVSQYKIDGFTLMGDGINMDIILEDPLLKKTYLFKDYFSEEQIAGDIYNRLFISNDEYLYTMRKLIATRQANMAEAYQQIKKQGLKEGYVNYITYHNGFTLKDLFSYAMKHNEENGEYNRDGLDFNFSTNCGIEGESRKKTIVKKRRKNIFNSIAMMALSQGIPMFLAGDEIGNSQNGNNNAYCQDNSIGWVNWKKSKESELIYEFTERILKFRREHAMIRRAEPMAFKDSLNCGMPDVSLHGTDAWISSIGWNAMEAGICYCSAFVGEKENVYMAFNFSNSLTSLALPEDTGRKGWKVVMDTNSENPFVPANTEAVKKSIQVAPNSIVLLVSAGK
ncbi:MAG: glycogen operon protein GlgX [Lachnospiraceae bacterium]|nr:glycogen operon protein GlgX [Lachnospiraceae bacterium]